MGFTYGTLVQYQRKDLEATTAQQHQEIQALTATLTEQATQIQKVSAQLEARSRAVLAKRKLRATSSAAMRRNTVHWSTPG
jgi:uncharacterized coiled-coil protein SlyX